MNGFATIDRLMGQGWKTQNDLIQALEADGFRLKIKDNECITGWFPEGEGKESFFDIMHTNLYDKPEEIRIRKLIYFGTKVL